MDYPYAIENGLIPEDYEVWWGYEDEKLFEFAKEKLGELSTQDEPFNLTILTVDTHYEDGYVCEECQDEFGDQYSNVLACSSRQVTGFVEWLKEQDFYEDTTIVIAGDHLTMDSYYLINIDPTYDRRTYVTYINSALECDNVETRVYSTFDLFPTTLAAMGVNIDGDRLGLGVNLYSDNATLLEEYGIYYVRDELGKRSKLIDRYARITLE